MEETVTIRKSEYLSLLMSEEKLNRLECGGVNNWEWYGESINPEGRPDLDDYEKELVETIKTMK